MMKKYAGKVLAAAMAVSMVMPGVNVLAADANTTSGTTQVKYDVTQAYTWVVPTQIDFTNAKDATVTTSGTSGNTQNVQVTNNVIPNGKKLHITIEKTTNSFSVISTEGAKLSYTVKVGENNTALAAGGTVLDVNAGTNKGSATLKFELTKDSVEKAGNYTDTITYKSEITNQQ